ncbi:DnaJ domain-containing protein [Candidatus Bipolaricaulota bacterium]|nr:DnaJ domain-containing protein [Candidatus Bipolaricaulota bacterium]
MADDSSDGGGCLGWLFGIGIGVLVLILILGLIYFVLQIAWITLPAWGVATVLMFGALYLFTSQRFRALNPQGTFAKTVAIRFDSRKMKWYLQETARESYGKAGLVMTVAIILALLPLWLILGVRYRSGAFQGVIWWLWFLDSPATIPQQAALVCGCILSVIPIIGLAVLRFESVENSLSTRAQYLVKHMNGQLERTEELRSLTTSIGAVADHIGIPFPMIFQQKVAKFANAHKAELLADTTNKLNKMIVRTIEEAQEDVKELKKAQEAYDTAMKLYDETTREVNRTGSISLIRELEGDYEGLTPECFGELLVKRDWAAFHSVADSLIEDIERLKEVALKYQREGYEEEPKDRKEEEPDRGEMTEERAYSIFRALPPMSCTQLKSSYRELVKGCHPDKKEDKKKADALMRDLNLAYAFLKKIGKCD